MKLILLPLMVILFTGCLKTRAQIREDSPNSMGRPASGPSNVGGDEGYAVEEIKGEINRLTGRIDQLERKKSPSDSDAMTSMQIKKIESRISELEATQLQILTALKNLEQNATPPDPSALLERGKRLLKTGEFTGAISAINSYLGKPKIKGRSEAYFIRGEAYFSLKNYKKAIEDYHRIPEKYPKSTLMPRALYKIGLSFESLGFKDDSRLFYRDLVDKYPKSREARLAKPKLASKKKKKKKSRRKTTAKAKPKKK